MRDNAHAQAKLLLDTAAIEGIPATDRAWLDAHLEACPDCSAYSATIGATVSALRAIPVSIPPQLVEVTRRRARTHAHELREQRARMSALWITCALSWVLGTVSAPVLWWGVEWIGQRFALPQPVWVLAFVFWWFAPATLMASVLTWQKFRQGTEEGTSTFGLW
jgi:anti-sigma factor RsiW